MREQDSLRRDLERAASESGTLVVEALHDVKAPLHAVSGLLHLIADERVGQLTTTQREFVAAAALECSSLQTFVEDFVQGAARALTPPPPQVVNAADLVETAVANARLRSLGRGTHVEIVAFADDELSPVLVDRPSILRVFDNLLDNALRLVTAETRLDVATVKAWDRVAFMVADRGPGLPSTTDAKRVGSSPQLASTGTRGSSSGLGLWISRRLVEAYGGTLWAENRAGGGARVCFTLPAHSASR